MRLCMSAAALLAVALTTSPAAGYEYYIENGVDGPARLGQPIDVPETRRAAGDPAVELRLNLLRVDDQDNDGKADATSPLSPADVQALTSLIHEAVRMWDMAPGSSMRLRVGGAETSSVIQAQRPYILVTVGSLSSPRREATTYTRLRRGQLFSLGIHLNYGQIKAPSGRLVAARELGHALGLRSSSLDRQLTNNKLFDYSDAGGAFLSGRPSFAQYQLHPDDIAGLAQLYPDPSSLADYGSVRGELVTADGRPFFGGNVFLIGADKAAKMARISGLSDWRGFKEHGIVHFQKVPPGTYTLVAASLKDDTFRIGTPVRYPFDRSYDKRELKPAIRREVVVRAGQQTDFGRLVSGVADAQGPRGTVLRWPALSQASSYRVYLYNRSLKSWVLRGQSFSSNECMVVLDDGEYKLTVRGVVGSTTTLVESRTFQLTGELPIELEAPDEVTGYNGRQIRIPFSFSDPLGRPVKIRMQNLPLGAKARARSIEFTAMTGDYEIILTAYEDPGTRKTVRTIKVHIDPLPPQNLTLYWPALPGEQSFRIRIYDIDRRGWLDPVYVTGEESVRFPIAPGNYRFHFYQHELREVTVGGRTYIRAYWVKRSQREAFIDRATRVRLLD